MFKKAFNWAMDLRGFPGFLVSCFVCGGLLVASTTLFILCVAAVLMAADAISGS